MFSQSRSYPGVAQVLVPVHGADRCAPVLLRIWFNQVASRSTPVASWLLPVLKMSANAVNRDSTGVNRDATAVNRGQMFKAGLPRGHPGLPRWSPVYPSGVPVHPGAVPFHPGAVPVTHSLSRIIPVYHGRVPVLSRVFTVSPRFYPVSHFNTTVKAPRFAPVYPGSSRYGPVTVHPGLLRFIKQKRTGELNRNSENNSFKGRLHGKINLMRFSLIRQILPCKHC